MYTISADITNGICLLRIIPDVQCIRGLHEEFSVVWIAR
jgi:hypothetical protein